MISRQTQRMKTKNNHKKIILVAFLAFSLLFPSISLAQIPSTSGSDIVYYPGGSIIPFYASNSVLAMDSIMNDLGIDKSEVKYSVRDMNVHRRKKQQPQVSVTFEPSDPVPGQKVTAIATPTYFMNDSKDLYFTWFLKTEGTDNIKEMKIKAARILANNDFDWENADYDNDADNDGYVAPMGGDDQRDKNNYCFIHDVNNGNDYRMPTCDHLFPNATGDRTGDGCFSCAHGGDCREAGNKCSSDYASEEHFWRTDPTDEDTAANGQKDEATISGLGATSFSWTYSAGDKVGVVVEGVSIEYSQEEDSAYRIMWAFPVEDSCQSELESHTNWRDTSLPDYYYTEMEPSDINDCLEKNLIDPAEGGGTSEKMDVSLSYLPEFPINDPNTQTNEGDEVIVNSTVTNAQNNGYLRYSWQVYKSNDPNPDSWGSPIPKSQLAGVEQLTGMNLETLKFRLNFSNLKSPTYFKVKLTVTENISNSVVRKGRADVVFPVFSTNEKIRAYTTSVSDLLTLSANEEICREGVDKNICPVTKNQIVTLGVNGTNLTDFAWSLNGESIGPLSSDCSSGECVSGTGESTKTAYFAVTGEPGEIHTINLAATNQETGQKVNLVKIFKIIEPDAYIYSADESTCQPLLLGNYVDIDGNHLPDVSQDQFEAISESEIKLKPEFNGFYWGTPDYAWNIDGNIVDKTTASSFGYSIDDDNVLTLPYKLTGNNYVVSINALYSADSLRKKALNKYWNVQPEEFYEKLVSKGANIEIVDSFSSRSALSKGNAPMTKKVLAAVASGAPNYLIFLIRSLLIGFLIVFSAGFLLSFLDSKKHSNIES